MLPRIRFLLLFCRPMKYATLVISVLILIAVLIPGRDIPDVGFGGIDKIVHIGMFATWALAVRYDFDRQPFPFLIVFLGGLFFSVSTEVLQILVEGRTFDLHDMAADAVGVVAGLLIGGPIVKRIKRRG